MKKISSSILNNTFKKSSLKYSTQFKLREDYKEFLNKTVIEQIEKKNDSKLINRLNFAGRIRVARLNTASPLVLQFINSKNVFKVLQLQVKDPWQHYWYEVLKNGTDGEKWLKTLESLHDNPGRASEAFRFMSVNGCAPTIRHYNEFFKILAKYGCHTEYLYLLDQVERVDESVESNDESYEIFLTLCMNIHHYTLGRIYYDIIQKQGRKISSEVQTRWNSFSQNLQEKESAAAKFLLGDAPRPTGYNGDTHIKDDLKVIADNYVDYIQPKYYKDREMETYKFNMDKYLTADQKNPKIYNEILAEGDQIEVYEGDFSELYDDKNSTLKLDPSKIKKVKMTPKYKEYLTKASKVVKK